MEQKKELVNLLHLTEWLHPSAGLQMDQEAAHAFLQRLTRSMGGKAFMNLSLSDYRVARNRVLNRLDYGKRVLEKFARRDAIDVTVTKGRLHTPVTNLMRPLKHYLSFKGESLVTIDLKNSQPLHLSLFFRQTFWDHKEPWSLFKLFPQLYQHLEVIVKGVKSRKKENILSQQDKEIDTFFIMYARTGNKNPHLSDNKYFKPNSCVSHFQKLVSKGELYEYLTKHFSGKFFHKNLDMFGTRSRAKRSLLHMMYHDPTEPFSLATKPFKLFKEHFPEEATLISLFKSRDYRDFPILLQMLEGHLLLKIVTKKIAHKLPNAPLFTIHDAVLTTESYAGEVQRLVEGFYQDFFGFKPVTDTEHLNPTIPGRMFKKYKAEKLEELLEIPHENLERIVPPWLTKLKLPRLSELKPRDE